MAPSRLPPPALTPRLGALRAVERRRTADATAADQQRLRLAQLRPVVWLLVGEEERADRPYFVRLFNCNILPCPAAVCIFVYTYVCSTARSLYMT